MEIKRLRVMGHGRIVLDRAFLAHVRRWIE